MKKLYKYYIGIGLLYVLVKILFVSFGYLHLGAILHGLIPSILTILAGFIIVRNIRSNKKKGILWIRIAMLFSVLVFVMTPIYMYFKEGAEIWLSNGRLQVLIIYEILAILQFIIIFRLLEKLKQN